MKSFINVLLIIILLLNIQSTELLAKNENIAEEMRSSLINEILDAWYPRTVDTVYGGFLSDFNYEWQASDRHSKMLVNQTRHIWTTSKMADFLGDDKYLTLAKNGYDFLYNKMWDKKNGGFYFIRDRQGNEITFMGNGKDSYSNSFAVYSLASYYKVSNDKSALDLAIKTFHWIEKQSYDTINKGYFNYLKDGENFRFRERERVEHQYTVDPSWKDQNSSIHLLEAFTELYSVWPDSLLRERTIELLNLIRDVIVTEKGYLNLYLTSDWQPISFRDSSKEVRDVNYHLDHVSFGHDVETAYLMLEASHVLGYKNDTNTLAIAKKMIDHSLKNGWDKKNGGFYYEGYYYKDKEEIEIINSVKTWWVEAEGLNALLMMSKIYPEEKQYYEGFLLQWEYIKKYLVDHKNGGWYTEGLDNSPEMSNMPKAYNWKANYHNVRALMNCIEMLSEK